jgi:hypothetical protein
MIIKGFIRSAILGFCLLTAGTRLFCEAEAAPELTNDLIWGISDFRRYLIPMGMINSLSDRNKVYLISWMSGQSEHDATEWTNVSAMLKSLGYSKRRQRTPQIRVVQKDTIFQSERERLDHFDPVFLKWPLHAGDIVILAPPIDKP